MFSVYRLALPIPPLACHGTKLCATRAASQLASTLGRQHETCTLSAKEEHLRRIGPTVNQTQNKYVMNHHQQSTSNKLRLTVAKRRQIYKDSQCVCSTHATAPRCNTGSTHSNNIHNLYSLRINYSQALGSTLKSYHGSGPSSSAFCVTITPNT